MKPVLFQKGDHAFIDEVYFVQMAQGHSLCVIQE